VKRDASLLGERRFDLLVCGGGIYGAWTAYDAALRGLSVAIIEQQDWAAATSSCSSKLIHGGLRYLETRDIKLVRKALRERKMLFEAAPHCVWPLRFGVPVYRHSRIGRARLKAGLTLYDLLAGRPSGDMAHRYFGSSSFSERFPSLAKNGLTGGFTYGDGQTDDARLVLELISGAVAAGAVCVNYCRLIRLVETGAQAFHATALDVCGGDSIQIAARQVVCATGRWIAEEQSARDWCRLSKGVHIVMPGTMSGGALLLTAASDGRVFFLIPWYGVTLVGTTDTDFRGEIRHVSAEADDIAYLLSAVNQYLKTAWTEADIIGSYAGIRVMRRSDALSPSDASRDWELRTAGNGVHYSVGGKLTSAREDAGCIVDTVCAQLGLDVPCPTKGLRFPWAPNVAFEPWSSAIHDRADQFGIPPDIASWLIRRHGRHVDEVLAMIETNPELSRRIVPELPLIYSDLLFCARTEMAVTLEDLLRRRMPLMLLARLSGDTLRRVAEAVAPIMGWDEAAINREVSCVSER
jgi:glycerol-3-phosphate dehydrogenase